VCQFANILVPRERPLSLHEPDGLYFDYSGEVQHDLARWSAAESSRHGTIICVSGKQCLCGFNDWRTLYQAARRIRDDNEAEWVMLLLFWTSASYPLQEEKALNDDESPAPINRGHLLRLVGETIEQRRWRHLLETLAASEGETVQLVFHDGHSQVGLLKHYNPEGQFGILHTPDGKPLNFSAAQLRSVKASKP